MTFVDGLHTVSTQRPYAPVIWSDLAKRRLRTMASFPVFLAFALAVLTVLTVTKRFNDPDLWWHLKIGEFIWNTHTVPRTDFFSFTTNAHQWTAHEWLSQLSLYGAYHVAGLSGLMLWLCVVASTITVAVYMLCYVYSGNSKVAFFGGLIAWYFGTVGFAIRPLLLGHVFLTAELLFLELGRRHDRRWFWVLPPLFVLWVNCHASYLFGLGVLVLYCLCSHFAGQYYIIVSSPWDPQTRTLFHIIVALCGAALFLNPIGPELLRYPIDTFIHQSTNSLNVVQEWAPPRLLDGRCLAMLGLLATVVSLVSGRRSAIRLEEVLLLACVLALAFQHVRMLALFGIVAAPIVCRVLRGEWQFTPERDHPMINAILLAFSLVLMTWTFPDPRTLEAQVRRTSPVKAVQYIKRAGLPGPMLNQYHFGGYLIWALPERRVFVDGRADVFDWTGVSAEYVRWEQVREDPALLLTKYNIRLCVLATGAPYTHLLPYLPGWRKVYSDDVAAVFAR